MNTKAMVVGFVAAGLFGLSLAEANKKETAATPARISQPRLASTATKPSRPQIATQKLLRDRWQRISLKGGVATDRSAVSNEEQP